MKFIFPQNYRFKSKFLGIMDYGTLIFNVICGIIIFGIVNILAISLSMKIFLFICLFIPIILMSIVGFNGENAIFVLGYIIKFLLKPKILLYKKRIYFYSKE